MKFRFRTLIPLLALILILPLTGISADASGKSGEWKHKDGKWYYYESSGKAASGWKKIGKKTYYFDPAGGNAMVTGFKTIKTNGKSYRYYFMDRNYTAFSSAKEGMMLTGFKTVKVKGTKRVFYFADSRFKKAPSGAMLTGFKTIAGNKYYFADKRYPSLPKGTRLSGWKTISGKKYYFADSRCPDRKAKGSIVTGFALIKGKAYHFLKSGVLDRGWASRNVIVIDPGHSSEVPDGEVPLGPGSKTMKEADNYGTQGIVTGVREYELNLTMSLKLRDALQKKGYKVVMVRTTNKGVYSCVDRAKTANRHKTAVFLRIHANAAPKDHSKNGAMTICITPDNPFIPSMYKKSRILSEVLLSSYVNATGCFNEGVWETDTMIANNWCKYPTTLIELGYMTNSKEDALMQTSAYQKKMLAGLVNGIDEYFKKTAD